MNKFEHDTIYITSRREIADDGGYVLTWNGGSSAWVPVSGRTYSITIGSGGAGGWAVPPGVTHVILTGCGGGQGSK